MKIKYNIVLLLLLMLSMVSWAQEIQKEYFRYPTEYVSQCNDGGTYVWRGKNLYSGGTYYDTIKTTSHIDSVYTINLTYTDKFQRTVNFIIQKGDSLTYRGVTYKAATKKDLTIPGDMACDTIEHLNITYSAHIDRYASSYFCKDTMLLWHGQWIYKTGEYLAHSATGDTTYHYTVTIDKNNPPTIKDTLFHCTQVEPFMWHGIKISKAGNYTAQLPSKQDDGCDTTAMLTYIVGNNIPPTVVTINVCGSKPYIVHGQKYYGDHEFSDVHTSKKGCDSIVITKYVSAEGTYYFLNDSNDFNAHPKYYWEKTGKYYSKAGQYIDSVASSSDCKTLYYLYLAPITHTYITGCEGEQYTFEGQLVTQDTVFRTITYTDEGWMSKVVYTHYEFNPKIIVEYEPVLICHDEVYRWYYNTDDPKKYLDISEKSHKLNQTTYTEITQQRGNNKCEKSSIKVMVRPYTIKTIPRIVRPLDTCMIKDYYWSVRPGDTIIVHQTKDEKRIYTDTVRSVVTGCDSLYTQREFVCTSHCSPIYDYYLYKDTISVLGQPYWELGQYQIALSIGKIDSIYNFRIVPYTPPTPRDSIAQGCYLNTPVKVYKRDYYFSQLDTIHFGYRRQPECDSALLALDIRIAERMHDTIYTGFCANDSFTLPILKRVIYEAGIYFDTLRDDTGCDSIVPYQLTKWPNPYHVTSKYLWPDSLPYQWTFYPKQGEPQTKLLTQPGDYQNTFVMPSGCDSIEILRLLSVDSYYFPDTIILCNNELPYMWRGREFTETGDYYDSLTTICCQQDSVYHLHLVVNDTISVLQTVALFPHDKYTISWKDLTLKDTASIFSVKLARQQTGCDSIFQVKIVPAIITRVTLDTCIGATFKGHIVTEDFQFYDTVQSRLSHTDSIIHYSIIAHAPTTYIDTVNLLYQPGHQYLWRDTLITSPGTYYSYEVSRYGCTDTYILIASLCTNSPTTTVYHYPCQGYPIIIASEEFLSDTVVIEHHTTANGCDSTTINDIKYRKAITHRESEYIYPNDTIRRGTHSFTKPGVYFYDTVPTFDFKCDSIIYVLELLRPEIFERDTNIFLIYLDLPYQHHGEGLYWDDRTFTDTFYNALGKDSLYWHWHYKITDAYSDTIFYDLCQGDTLYVNNLKIYESGYYTAHLKTQTTDKDSLFRCYVRVITPIETFVNLEGCDTIQYSGQTFYYKGSEAPFNVDLKHRSLVTGCDSIEHLKIIIHPSPPIVRLHVTYPDNEVFKYRDREYTHDTDDTIRISMPNTCDTVEYIHIQFYNSQSEGLTFYCCRGESIIVSDRPIYPTKDTVINDITTKGSTTYIKRIRIIVRDPYELHRDPSHTDQEAAAGKQVLFQVAYQTTGTGKPDFYDVHFIENGIEAVPYDSTYVVDIHSTEASSVYPIIMRYRNDDCIYPGKYKFTITFRSKACVKCNMTDTLTLTVLYPAGVMSSKWNNVVALSPHYTDTAYENSDCYWELASPYEWRINGERVLTEGDPLQAYLYVKSGIQDGSLIQFTAARKGHTEIVGSYPYTFHHEQARPGSTGAPHTVTVTPTLVPKRMAVHVESNADGTYALYHATGNLYFSGQIQSGATTLQMPGQEGCYLLQIQLPDGSTHVERLIVY